MAGIRLTIPTTFTDTTLPLAFHSAGISGYNYRYVARLLPSQSGVGDGADVTSWPSVGALATAMTPTGNDGTAGAPVYRANSGNPFVEFNGTSDGLGVTPYTAGAVKTAVMIVRHPGTGGGNPIISGSNALMTQNGTMLISGNSGASPYVALTPNAWHVAAMVVNGNSSFTVVDGVKSTETPIGATGAMATLRLGKEASNWARFDIAELITYSDVKTEANIATIRAALQAAYPDLGL